MKAPNNFISVSMRSVLALFLLYFVPLTSSFASELKVMDCAGNLRASTEIEEGASKGLRFKLGNNGSFSGAKLSKIEADTILESHATADLLKFDSVQSGSWKLCKSSGSELAFESVEFIDGPESSLKVASLLAGSAALASGIAIASEDSDSKDSETVSIVESSNGPDRGVKEIPVKNLRPANEIIVDSRCNKIGAKPASSAARAQSNNPCREGEDAPVISPYD